MKKSLFDKIYWILSTGFIFYSMLPMLYVVIYPYDNKITNPIMLISEACEQRELCPQYKKFRNECALAVDFEKCLLIKTDGEIKLLACNNDGTSNLIKKINPNAFFCFGTTEIIQSAQLISKIMKQ